MAVKVKVELPTLEINIPEDALQSYFRLMDEETKLKYLKTLITKEMASDILQCILVSELKDSDVEDFDYNAY